MNAHLAYNAVGLDPRRTLHWNVVPWPTGGTTLERVPAAVPWLAFRLDLLPQLRVVVVLGGDARDAWLRALSESSELPLLPTLWAPHPSWQELLREGSRERLHAVSGRGDRRVAPSPTAAVHNRGLARLPDSTTAVGGGA
jgi:hypothetical protein